MTNDRHGARVVIHDLHENTQLHQQQTIRLSLFQLTVAGTQFLRAHILDFKSEIADWKNFPEAGGCYSMISLIGSYCRLTTWRSLESLVAERYFTKSDSKFFGIQSTPRE